MPSRADKRGSLPAGGEEARAAPPFPSGAGHGSLRGGRNSREIRSRGRRGREKASMARVTRRSPCLSPSLVSFPQAVPALLSPFLLGQASFIRADFIWVYFQSSGKWDPGQSVPTHTVSVVEGCWILPCWD